MTEDLLEEMNGDMENDSLDRAEVSSQEPSGEKSFIKRPPGNKKRFFLILLIGVVLIGILAGCWIFFFRETSEEALLPDETHATEQGSQAVLNESDKIDEIVFEDIIELEPFERIRLKGNSAFGFVSLDVSLELLDHRYREQVYSMQDRIIKIIMDKVGEMRWFELRNPEGKIQLKYELLKQINAIFPKVMVRNIYFINLIMQ